MTDIESMYRNEGEFVLIEIQLNSVIQMFNSFDPAPFHEKELDSDTERYIVDTVNDFPSGTKFKIIIYLPEHVVMSRDAQEIPKAVKNHFEYKVITQKRHFRSRIRYGRFTILVGLSALAVSMFASLTVSESFPDCTFAQLIANALEVAGWVAMWEPVTVFLYQLWPMIKLRKTYEKISMMNIDIRPWQTG